MKTDELTDIIGAPLGDGIIIRGAYGNATLHQKHFWSCDPCYLPDDLLERIRAAYHKVYPWEGYAFKHHRDEWCDFMLDGQTCYARDCSDGEGYFGNCVDSGWVVVLPFNLGTQFMRDHVGQIVMAPE